MADEAFYNYSDLIGKDSTFDDLSDEIADLKAELLDLAKSTQKAFSSIKPSDTAGIESYEKKIKELVISQKSLLKVEQMAQKAKKKNIQLTQEELVQAQAEKLAQRERVKEAKQLAILRKAEAGSIEALRAKLSLATIKWKALSKEERENGKIGKSLVKDKLKLTNQLKALEKQTGDTRRNVGNYTDSLSKLGKVTARVFLGRTAIDGLRRIGTAFSDIIEKNKETDKTIGALSDALGQFGKSAGGVGLTILKLVAGPLTSLLNGVKSFLDFLSGANNETKKFQATSEELAGATEKLSQEFTKEAAAADQVFTALENANEGSKERKDLIDQVNKQYGKYLPNLLDEKSTLEDIADAQRLVNQALTQGFLIRIQQATQTDIFTNKVKAQRAAFENLRDVAERTGKTIDASLLASFSELIENLGSSSDEFEAIRDILEGNTNSFSKFNQELFKTNPSLLELARQLKVAGDSDTILALLNSAAADTNNYNEAITDTQASLKGLQDGLVTYDKTVEKNTSNVKDNTKATKDNADARLKALEQLRDAVENAEAENIEERTRRALELERLRFEREQELRNENFNELQIEFKDQAEELKQIEALNQKLSEEQLQAHENNKKAIRLKGAEDATQITTINLQDSNSAEKALLDEKVELVEDSNAKIKKSNEELFSDISKAAQKVSAIVNDLFKKQVDQAANNVEEQTKNLERAEERAQQGLESNIAFERKELAARQSERLQREKEAANAAKLTTLFNLVSAYAQGGDENALFRGLADFALLEAFGAGIQGFFEGTENVDRDIGTANKFFQGKRDAYLGVTNSGKLLRFDGQERIFNPSQNAMLGGMSNDEAVNNALIGSWVSDNFNPSSIMGNSFVGGQMAEFQRSVKIESKKDDRLIQEVRGLKQAINNQPSSSVDMEKVYKNITDLVKREIKNAMQRTTKIRLK